MLLRRAAVPCSIARNAVMLIVVVRYIYTKVLTLLLSDYGQLRPDKNTV
jgi:hypothetical protein